VTWKAKEFSVTAGREAKCGLGGGLIVLVVGRDDGLQVFGFEHLVAVQAPYIVHTIAACQDFGAGMITGLHRREKEIIPILSM
jgi:hypothetical protein